MSSSFFPVSFRALIMAAAVTTAVPCWVIVENRNITALFQLALDLKAAGSGDILQIYTAEASGQQSHCIYNIVHLFTSHAQRESIHSAKDFEEHAFPLHYGMPASGPISPRPRTAVPSVTTATMLPRRVYL